MQRKKRTGETLQNVSCEVCSFNNPAALHIHHIIPRADPRCSKTFRKELDFVEKYRKIVDSKCEK